MALLLPVAADIRPLPSACRTARNIARMERGWGFQPPPAAPLQLAVPQHAFERHQFDQQPGFTEQDVAELASRALRVLLGADSALLHAQLRLAVLGGRGDAEGGSRSKCLLELAVASLVEQGLVVRQGYGPLAALSVPDAAMSKAEAIAYSEFPDEGKLPLLYAGAGGFGSQQQQLGGHHHRPPCLNRLRRHSSPRQFSSRMSGIEKASGRRSMAKRSVGEDISNQLQKKMRFVDGSAGGGPFGGGGSAPCSPGGLAAMSP